jgi:hypothetical protein
MGVYQPSVVRAILEVEFRAVGYGNSAFRPKSSYRASTLDATRRRVRRSTSRPVAGEGRGRAAVAVWMFALLALRCGSRRAG